MGPILSMTYGVSVHKTDIILRGMRNEIVGVLISLLVGLVMGIVSAFVYGSDFRSHEMISRGNISGLLLGLVIAAASAVAIVLAVSKGGFNAIVGTAISASLLPPVVNCGLCMGFTLVITLTRAEQSDAIVFFNTGLVSRLYENCCHPNCDAFCCAILKVSFGLWLSNFVIIILFGFGTFRYQQFRNDSVFFLKIYCL